MVMTLSMTSPVGLKFLYIWNKIIFRDSLKRASFNLLYMFMLGLWLYIYKFLFMTPLITSSDSKIVRNYPRWYFSSKYWKWSWLPCSYIQPPLSLPVKTDCCDFKMAAILKIQNINNGFNLTSDIISSQIMPEMYGSPLWRYRWRQRITWNLPPILMFRKRVTPGASCKGSISLIDANIVIVSPGFTCLRKSIISKIQDHRSKVKVTGLLSDIGT